MLNYDTYICHIAEFDESLEFAPKNENYLRLSQI